MKIKTVVSLVISSLVVSLALLMSPKSARVSEAKASPPCSQFTIQQLNAAYGWLNGYALPTNVEIGCVNGDTYNGGSTSCALKGGKGLAILRAYIWQKPNGPYVVYDVNFISLDNGCESLTATINASAGPGCYYAYISPNYISAYCPCPPQP